MQTFQFWTIGDPPKGLCRQTVTDGNTVETEYLDKSGHWIAEVSLYKSIIEGDLDFEKVSYQESIPIAKQILIQAGMSPLEVESISW